MNVQELQFLLQELLQAIEQVVLSGEELSDEFQGMLAQTLELLYGQIEELSGNPVEGLPAGRQTPELESSMPSSNVEGFAYDDENERLLVRFLGKYPDKDGPIYSYDGVPPNIFDIFRRGAIPAKTNGKNKWGQWWRGTYPSMGAAMYHLIRAGGYPYQRIS